MSLPMCAALAVWCRLASTWRHSIGAWSFAGHVGLDVLSEAPQARSRGIYMQANVRPRLGKRRLRKMLAARDWQNRWLRRGGTEVPPHIPCINQRFPRSFDSALCASLRAT